MPQFTPADRQTVKEHVESMASVAETANTHAGIVMRMREQIEVDCIGRAFSKHGWIADSIDYNSHTVTIVPAGQPAELNR